MIHVNLLQDYLQCETKSYLHFQGRSGLADEYSMLSVRLDACYRASAFQWLATHSTTAGIKHFNGSRLENLAAGPAMILDALGGADGLETHFHGLQRVPGDSRLGPYSYRPIRVYRHLQPSSAVRLLLAFDALVLGRLQGLSSDDGVLICGPGFKRIRVRLQTYRESLTTILTRLRRQIASNNELLLTLNRHCDLCEFKQSCRVKAVAADNLTLLKGMTSKEMARHNSKGIFTVNQLSYTFRARRPAKRQRQRFPHSYPLQALAMRENKVHVHGEPSLTLPPTKVYLDIEGLPDRRFHYLIGALVVTGQSEECHSFWADDESQQVTIFVQLAELLTTISSVKGIPLRKLRHKCSTPNAFACAATFPEGAQRSLGSRHEHPLDSQLPGLLSHDFQQPEGSCRVFGFPLDRRHGHRTSECSLARAVGRHT